MVCILEYLNPKGKARYVASFLVRAAILPPKYALVSTQPGAHQRAM